jgi:hypothetical protein
MGFWDSLGLPEVGGIVNTVGNFISDNKGWMAPVASGIIGYQQKKATDDARNQYTQYVGDMIDQRNSAMNDYYAQLAAQRSGGSGGGNGAANRAAQLGAMKKATNYQKKALQKIMKDFQPYADAGKEILPLRTEAYKRAMASLASLSDKFGSPQAIASFGPVKDATQMTISLPDYMMKKA